MAEQTGGIVVEREALDLGNESGWYAFYLWRYRESARADRYLTTDGKFDAVPPELKLSEAVDAGLPLDAVVVYGRAAAPTEVLSADSTRTLQRDLESNFVRTRVSAAGNAEVWLRDGLPPPC